MAEVAANLVEVYVFRRRGSEADLLLLRRRTASVAGGTWQIVQGGIEPGEVAPAAARREMAEETGLAPERLWQVDTVHAYYLAAADRVVLCPCFAAEVQAGAQVVLNAEHTDWSWRPVAEAEGMLLWPGQRRILREIRDEILAPGPAEPLMRIEPP